MFTCCCSTALSLSLCVCLDDGRRHHTICDGGICLGNEVSQMADILACCMGYACVIIHILLLLLCTCIGIPLFIVAISVGIRHDLYGTNN